MPREKAFTNVGFLFKGCQRQLHCVASLKWHHPPEFSSNDFGISLSCRIYGKNYEFMTWCLFRRQSFLQNLCVSLTLKCNFYGCEAWCGNGSKTCPMWALSRSSEPAMDNPEKWLGENECWRFLHRVDGNQQLWCSCTWHSRTCNHLLQVPLSQDARVRRKRKQVQDGVGSKMESDCAAVLDAFSSARVNKSRWGSLYSQSCTLIKQQFVECVLQKICCDRNSGSRFFFFFFCAAWGGYGSSHACIHERV